ncbi:hypothetical protein HDU83_005943 [Entophlyctis luteolus]|nr:hypothetical protein HDU83_005943 [Entophlyctis luteolus]
MSAAAGDDVFVCLIAEHSPAAPVPALKFQYPRQPLLLPYHDPTPLMIPIPGVELRNEDSFSFMLLPKPLNPTMTASSGAVVPRLRKFPDPRVQIALVAEAYSNDGSAWRPMSSSRCVVQLTPDIVSVWDEPCLRAFAEMFFSEEDEILFVNHLNENFDLREKSTAGMENISHITSLYNALLSARISHYVPRLTVAERIILRLATGDSVDALRDVVETAVSRSDGTLGPITDDWDGKGVDAVIEHLGTTWISRIGLGGFEAEVGEFSVTQFVTIFSATDAIQPPDSPYLKWRNNAPYFWHPHLDSGGQTHPLVFLVNAVLTEKRIVIVGGGRSGGDISRAVFALGAIGSAGGVVGSDILSRLFAVIGIQEIEKLPSQSGFIAGTTDIGIEDHPHIWDVLCDINTGRIFMSPKLFVYNDGMDSAREPDGDIEWMKQGFWLGDAEFALDVVTAIQNEVPEFQVRQLIYDHVQRFADVTATYEIETLNTSMLSRPPPPPMYPGIDTSLWFKDEVARNAELVMLRNRIEAWKTTSSYFSFLKKHNEKLQKSYIPATVPLHAILDQIYKSSPQIATPLLVQMLLLLQDTLLPGPDGAQVELLAELRTRGVQIFAAGMMHERWEVRHASTRILWRLDWHPIGTAFIQALNPFYRLCYARESHLLLNLPDDDPLLPTVASEMSPPGSAVSPAAAGPRSVQKRESKRQSVRNASATRMSLLFEERNANRIVFNSAKKGYMRGSVLSQNSIRSGLRVKAAGPSGLQKTPAWMQEVLDREQADSARGDGASIRSGSGRVPSGLSRVPSSLSRAPSGSGRPAGPARKPADMSDIDNVIRNFAQTGLQGPGGAVERTNGFVPESQQSETGFSGTTANMRGPRANPFAPQSAGMVSDGSQQPQPYQRKPRSNSGSLAGANANGGRVPRM